MSHPHVHSHSSLATLILYSLSLFLGRAIAQQPSTSSGGASPQPTIELGYARHTATNTTITPQNLTYHTYSNIRFAQPPTGSLRFRKPVVPPPVTPGISNGSYPGQNSTNCMQAIPGYFPSPAGISINGTAWGHEDCLFLDVIVPVTNTNTTSSSSKPLPVLHWIYGGGFFYGAKDWGGNPAAFLNTLPVDEDPFIVVASNYRMGPIGWMSAPGNSSVDVDVNIGLYDGLAALEWTRQYIGLFGGDPEQVTVMGQSAGAGIIEQLLAAEVPGQQMPFSQAILSSPGYRPHVDRNQEMADIYQLFLNITECADAECLRRLGEDQIFHANAYMMQDTVTNGFPGPSIGFGPVTDGVLVRDLPERVLNESARAVARAAAGGVKRVVAGGMKNDGVASWVGTATTYDELLKFLARSASNSTLTVLENLYGPQGNRSSFAADGSVTPTPLDELAGDVVYTCHSYFAAKAFSNSTNTGLEAYRYEMSIPPALHGQDLEYYFFDDYVASADPAVAREPAEQLQYYLRRFIRGQDMGDWREYSAEGLNNPSWMNITTSGLEMIAGEDERNLAERCGMLLELFGMTEDGW